MISWVCVNVNKFLQLSENVLFLWQGKVSSDGKI